MKPRPFDIRELKPSTQYIVRKGFTDFYNNRFVEGERLTFVSYSFLPYHGGHTVLFREKALYLQEEANADILASFHLYMSPVGE
jgi:hypothetical protein